MSEVAQAIANARNECDLGPSDAPSDVINNLVGYVRAFRELWIQSNGELSSAQFNYASEVGIQLGLRMRLEEFLGESFEALGDAVESAISALEEREKLRQDLAVIRDQLVVTGGVSFADQSRIERCHTIAKQALQSKDAKP